jgi:hypothetical protein
MINIVKDTDNRRRPNMKTDWKISGCVLLRVCLVMRNKHSRIKTMINFVTRVVIVGCCHCQHVYKYNRPCRVVWENFILIFVIPVGLIMITSLSLSLFLCSMAFVLASGMQQHLQYARGITNSTTIVCINGKCVTTTCIDNEQCRTPKSNSTKNKEYDSLSSASLEAV